MKVLEFDSLQGSTEPAEMFGEILSDEAYQEAFESIVQIHDKTVIRVQKAFGNFDPGDHIASHLDRLVKAMWNTGWDPDQGNLNLFTTDFGLLFTMELLKENGAKLIIRSKTILDHLSVWHDSSQSEYFPFHKMMKMLTVKNGESAHQMLNDLKLKTANKAIEATK